MKLNIIIGIGFIILALLLAYLSKKQVFGDGWLDKADKIASIISLIIAIVAFVNPFSDRNEGQSQQIKVDNRGGGSVISGQSGKGDVTIGDITTSAEQRAVAAVSRVKSELLTNFNNLAILITAVGNEPPKEFWDKRRVNESEMSYQDRATNEFRDYQTSINLYIKRFKTNDNLFGSFQRELSYNPELAQQVEYCYHQQKEAVDSFYRLETGLQHVQSLKINDIERIGRSKSLHKEVLANSKVAFASAAAYFCMIADQDDINILKDIFSTIGVVAELEPGAEGYRNAMKLAAKFSAEKVAVLQKRNSNNSEASQREINRRINDPYLIMLRKVAGLPPTLTVAELTTIKNKQLDSLEQDPVELFKLAAFSYLESDGDAASFYFQRAMNTNKLSPVQKKFAQLSLNRIERPALYGESLGIMIIKLDSGGSLKSSGLKVNDVIISINGQVVNEPLDIASELAKNVSEPVILGIVRNQQGMLIKTNNDKSAGALLTQLVVLNAIKI